MRLFCALKEVLQSLHRVISGVIFGVISEEGKGLALLGQGQASSGWHGINLPWPGRAIFTRRWRTPLAGTKILLLAGLDFNVADKEPEVVVETA